MQSSVGVVLLLCIGVALCAQQNLYPFTADGFDTVFLDDMSFSNQISIQTGGPSSNLTFFVYGESVVRTVYPGKTFYVGATPHESWHLPFIDFHTFQNGSDIWGFGPVNPGFNHTDFGYGFQVAVVTTKRFGNSSLFLSQPLGFEGTYSAVHVANYDPNNIIGYFAGFFANATNPSQLQFGVVRAHFNVSIFDGGVPNGATGWTVHPDTDVAAIYKDAQLVSYNPDFKPFLIHARNVSSTAPPNSTWIAVVEPYGNTITLVLGNIDPSVALSISAFERYAPRHRGSGFGRIVNVAAFNDLLFVGVSVPGLGTGWIDVLHFANLTVRVSIDLPVNYSDPRALVVDFYDRKPYLFVGMNGGSAVLRIDIETLKINGYQPLPFYLHRTWRGVSAPEHVYFVTNEQHSKVYRVAKTDFCPVECAQFGYCKEGKCVCSSNFELKNGKCDFKQVIVEKNIAKKEKGGEIALGFFFALSTVAAAVGWYLVWKSKRSSYQAV